MLVALIGWQANAAIYIVGSAPFGDWNPANGTEMTDNGDGTYTLTTSEITAKTIYFVFADGLSSDWNTFNGNYRYGPTTGSNEVIEGNTVVTTQKQGNGNGSYQLSNFVDGNEYTFTFNLNNGTFKVAGTFSNTVDNSYTVAGSEEVLGSNWSVTDTNNDMTLGADGIYTLTKTDVEIAAGFTLAFKVAYGHDWATAYPSANYTYDFTESGVYTLVFTFNPTTEEVGFTATKTADAEDPAEGDVVYNVAGSEASVFGTTWDPANTDNNMTLVDGIYTLTKTDIEMTAGTTLEFKVVKGNAWGTEYPSDNYTYTFDKTGKYTLVFMFNAETTEVGFTATLTEEGGEVDPFTGEMYILGNVNDNNWDPSNGVNKMTYDGDDLFTLTDAKFNTAYESEYSYFSFTTKLGENSEDWSFADYRFGATENGFEITQDLMGTLVDLVAGDNAFMVMPGVYDVTVYYSAKKVVLTYKGALPSDIVRGDANGDGTVDLNDVSLIIDYVLNSDAIDINWDNADCNVKGGDGTVDLNDVTELIDYVLNGKWRDE